MTRGCWAILVDGQPLEDVSIPGSAPLAAPLARHLARATSRSLPRAAVACVVLGEPETLRRFEAGKELAA